MHQLVLFSYFFFKLVALKICLRLKRDCPIRFQTMGIIQTGLKQWSFLNFNLNYFISQGPIVFQNKVNNTTYCIPWTIFNYVDLILLNLLY